MFKPLFMLIAGLKLVNKPNSFLIFNKPVSGFTSCDKESHFGPPTAPSKIASEFLQSLIVLFVNGIPY